MNLNVEFKKVKCEILFTAYDSPSYLRSSALVGWLVGMPRSSHPVEAAKCENKGSLDGHSVRELKGALP